MTQRPPFTPIGEHRDPMTVQSERLDVVFEQFEARARSQSRRFGLYAVLGAIFVVGFGIWGFGVETNTRTMTLTRLVRPRPDAPPVMVTISPQPGQRSERAGVP